MVSETATRLVSEARQLIMRNGYNGFSYADLAESLGIRKASIHHHFPTKVDLVVTVVEEARALIREQTELLAAAEPAANEQLRAYTGYWERCITDQSAPFCLAGVLAAEMPSLPPEVSAAVRGHFGDLSTWLTRVLALGVRQGTMQLRHPAAAEAEMFMASVYGAMLAARAFDDPAKFAPIVEASLDRIRPPG
ncbi:TetR/AcrR family transcriptional regulator [Roseomonas elaeocarpi]|uniref:TetR/AcrR family transcriptional regulator n=1 Tax=Roseomonas elaeocarpi TaxID=907779 RepID=A0ABV6JWH3_9PROT